MDKVQMEILLQQAADRALEARRRIEQAVDTGEVPAWVMGICEQWERAAFSYGASSVLNRPIPAPAFPRSTRLH